jgi:hypothetical protein
MINPPFVLCRRHRAKALRDKSIDSNIDLGGGDQQGQKSHFKRNGARTQQKSLRTYIHFQRETLPSTTSYNKGKVLRENLLLTPMPRRLSFHPFGQPPQRAGPGRTKAKVDP